MMLRLMPVAMTTTEEVCQTTTFYTCTCVYLMLVCEKNSLEYEHCTHAHKCMLHIILPFIEYGGFGSVGGKIETDIKINHEGEVNR